MMIYLDNNATTRPSPEVMQATLRYSNECFSNASALTAAFTGADVPRRSAGAAINKLLNAEEPECFIFTSGATESNNWIFSSIAKMRKSGAILVSAIEHPSVLEPAAELIGYGFQVIELPVNPQGIIDVDALRNALKDKVALVSIMAANNETGVLQPITEIGRLIRELSPDAIFHTDATQAVGKIPIDLGKEWLDVDLLSFSAHKFHGPKGVGGLYLRPGMQLPPLLLGGGQEEGYRSGTTNTPGLAGLAVAAAQYESSSANLVAGLRDQFESELKARFPYVRIHGADVERLPNTSCFSLPGVVGDDLVESLATEGIIVGTGSACSFGAARPSKTLLSMQVDYEVARAALRVSLDGSTSVEQLSILLHTLTAILTPALT